MQTTDIIKDLINHIKSECTAVDREAIFDEMLDECYSFEEVGGPFACMSPSRVLREVDPTAHRCGVNDFFGCDDHYIEVESETYRKDDADAARESFIEELDREIETIESDIEGLEAEEDADLREVASMKRRVEELKADRKTAEDYAL